MYTDGPEPVGAISLKGRRPLGWYTADGKPISQSNKRVPITDTGYFVKSPDHIENVIKQNLRAETIKDKPIVIKESDTYQSIYHKIY